ncbi:MAG: IS30 family transposase [Candidatus Synoicihabitans palmerolidicus]|nr:IS30 family transposase [Candidatus Synoicihabitans palmerolidicus]
MQENGADYLMSPPGAAQGHRQKDGCQRSQEDLHPGKGPWQDRAPQHRSDRRQPDRPDLALRGAGRPDHPRAAKTLTYDNGREMAQHAAFSLATKVAVYFCNPHSPWQRGAVANINGLIREYFPQGIDFNTVTKGQMAKAEWRLNNRPRIGLDGQSPAEVFHAIIQKTVH